MDLERTDDTFIFIQSSPLIAAFGIVDAYYVQQESTVIFDASTNSYDPDAVDDPKNNLTFTFYCRRACESWPAPNGMQVYTDWRNYDYAACTDLDNGKYAQQGCFIYKSNDATIRATYPGPRKHAYCISFDRCIR